MQVFHGLKEIQIEITGSVLTIGNFDGVHLGHQQLLKAVEQEAGFEGVPSIVYTFHPHPVKILHPERKTQRLFDLKDQQDQFSKFGIDYVIIEAFTLEFSKTSAIDFMQEYIFDKLNPKTIIVGHDFSFGSSREGNLNFLEKQCELKGVKLVIIPPFKKDERPVSSSRIRDELGDGHISNAEVLLGRRYYLRGHVEQGFQRGRLIGVPTANIIPDVEFIPRKGVYCTQTKVQGKYYQSISNIGVNPTFSEEGTLKPVKIESHIFDFNEQLYGQEVEVVLRHFIRDERKFSGLDELKSQIYLDVKTAKEWFKINA